MLNPTLLVLNSITANGVYLHHRLTRTRRRSGSAKYRQSFFFGSRSGGSNLMEDLDDELKRELFNLLEATDVATFVHRCFSESDAYYERKSSTRL